ARSNMPVRISAQALVRPRSDLVLELEDGGFFVGNEHGGMRIRRLGQNGRVARAVGEMLEEGTHTVAAIVDRTFAEHGVFPDVVYGILDPLFSKGYLFEEPEPRMESEPLAQLEISRGESAPAPARGPALASL
ncbi:MAG: hypothetical protein MI919_36830, partial [Holophagales bacterium]|nr:hypothetical protein [Holophagales bacterium]